MKTWGKLLEFVFLISFFVLAVACQTRTLSQIYNNSGNNSNGCIINQEYWCNITQDCISLNDSCMFSNRTNITNQSIQISVSNISNITCDYDGSAKNYIDRNKNCVINFLCMNGTVGFSDECGCGCRNETINESQTISVHEEFPIRTTENKPQTFEVLILNFAYSPDNITISAGDSVIWNNIDSTSHTVTSNSGNELDSNVFVSGGNYTHSFFLNGTYSYHCRIHPFMKATVTVS